MRSMPSSKRTLASLSSTTRILAFRMSAEVTMDLGPDSFGVAGLLPGEFQCSVQGMHELVDLDWFGEIPEESCLQALFDVARHGIGTEGNHGNVRRCRVTAKDAQGIDTTDAGQIDIHQDDVGLLGARELDTQIAVSGSQQAQIRTPR